jgi:hypothetical protein
MSMTPPLVPPISTGSHVIEVSLRESVSFPQDRDRRCSDNRGRYAEPPKIRDPRGNLVRPWVAICADYGHSESSANLLIHLGLNSTDYSECALILLKVLPDFDSTIRRFEFSRPEAAVLWLSKYPCWLKPAGGLSLRGSRSETNFPN